MASTTRPTQRTDEIRQRRTDRAHKGTQPKNRKTQPAGRRTTRSVARGAPPVMARSAAAGVHVRESKRTSKTRRRYDVALGVPGAEIRLPSLPQVGVGWRLASLFLVGLLSFALFYMWNSPTYRVQAAEVSGLQRLTSRDVEAVLGVTGESIFTLEPKEMEKEILAAFPEFSDASVQVGLSNTVGITVTERVPVLTWHQAGSIQLVDEQGMAFPQREGAQAFPTTLVEALSAPPGLDPAELEPEVLDLTAAPAAGDAAEKPAASKPVKAGPRKLLTPEMVKGIQVMAKQAPQGTPVVYDGQHGLGWKDARGWEVYFGDVNQIEMKLKVYQAIVQRLEAEGIQPALVSVEYVHAPYYRLER